MRYDCSGGAAPASSAPAVGSELAAEYNSDEEIGQASIQGSAATAADARDSGSHSANGLPSNFFEVSLSLLTTSHNLSTQIGHFLLHPPIAVLSEALTTLIRSLACLSCPSVAHSR